MKKLLYPLAAVLLMTGSASVSHASDVYLTGDEDESAITGIIDSVNDERIELIVNGERIDVDVDNLDLDDGQEDILKVGDEVRITGKFDDDEFDAESLILVTPQTDVNVVVD